MSVGGGLVMWARKPDADSRAPCVLRRTRRVVGATGGRCSTRPTPRGTFPTSSSGATLAPHDRRHAPRRDTAGVLLRRRHRRARARRAARPSAATPTFRAGGWSASGSAAWSLRARSASSGVATVGLGLLVFIAIGPLLVLAYNLELFGGWIHTDAGLRRRRGARSRCSSATSSRRARLDTHRGARQPLAAVRVSLAQRSLSTPARARCAGASRARAARLTMLDGTTTEIDGAALLAPLERALTALSWAMVALAFAPIVDRVLLAGRDRQPVVVGAPPNFVRSGRQTGSAGNELRAVANRGRELARTGSTGRARARSGQMDSMAGHARQEEPDTPARLRAHRSESASSWIRRRSSSLRPSWSTRLSTIRCSHNPRGPK